MARDPSGRARKTASDLLPRRKVGRFILDAKRRNRRRRRRRRRNFRRVKRAKIFNRSSLYDRVDRCNSNSSGADSAGEDLLPVGPDVSRIVVLFCIGFTARVQLEN